MGVRPQFGKKYVCGICTRAGRKANDRTFFVQGKEENVLLNGTQSVLNRLFQRTGFDGIDGKILMRPVVARPCQPSSRAGTVDCLQSYFEEDIELHGIYGYSDRLNSTRQEKIRQISVEQTGNVPGGSIGPVFYDVTTPYFETDYSDELRERGFSKDGKHSPPQVVSGLPVSAGGYPPGYSISV